MEYLLLCISVFSMVFQNALLNRVSKDMLKSNGDNYFFNMIQFFTAFSIFAVLSIVGGKISWYTVFLGALFGILTVLASVYKIIALSIGPLHITVLIVTASLIIPALSGVFFGEMLNVWKLIAITFLIFFIYLTVSRETYGAKVNRRWILVALFVFFIAGIIGVMQKIQQASPHRDETASFLAVSFFFSLIVSAILAKKEHSSLTMKFGIRQYAAAITSGLCVYSMNHINLYLSGALPSQLFFPLLNGSALILTTLISVLLFKEHLTRRQIYGVVGGVASLVAICFLG